MPTLYNKFVSNTVKDKYDVTYASSIGTGAFTTLYPFKPISISPATSSSKVLVSAVLATSPAAGSSNMIFSKMLRNNSTDIFVGDAASNRIRCTTSQVQSYSEPLPPLLFVDSPASASEQTYSLAYRTHTAAATLYYGTNTSGTPAVGAAGFGVSSMLMPAANVVLIDLDTTSGGSIKQVVTTDKSDTATSTAAGASFWSTGLSAAITPTSASSYLWIFGTINVGMNFVANGGVFWKLQRDGADILTGDAAGSRTRCTGGVFGLLSGADTRMGTININLMVPASSTSASTFQLLLSTNEGSATDVYINRTHTDTDSTSFGRTFSQLNVIEILPS